MNVINVKGNICCRSNQVSSLSRSLCTLYAQYAFYLV